ncbi:hypothetical protein SAMD00019534_009380 [Acytostelium subglobosum LB1]|uniref:hypothetical protein n=1 Tax=Acytostelium subglobosum LB1 TaxID=1410327 RepID=UPI00064518E3|nr:hypothetical protein SAMD00019534_009380 [Acytostelium subglobosum LB1]GAM17763.1 hypothetical protein SAMD00019534_009380 [Acytostelium subglobosum LB1]|eukprot:XP_012758359.1 hypothetical protein SAMD00019534_009380 [Acytostelium subglobosum LB1]
MPLKKNNRKNKKQNHNRVLNVRFGSQEVQQRWDMKKTTLENYAMMGLQFSNSIRNKERSEKALAKLNVVADPVKLDVKQRPPRIERGLTFDDQHYYRDLILKHNDNYEKMKMDIALNFWQRTAKQLENGCKRFIVLYGHPLLESDDEEEVEEEQVAEAPVEQVEQKQQTQTKTQAKTQTQTQTKTQTKNNAPPAKQVEEEVEEEEEEAPLSESKPKTKILKKKTAMKKKPTAAASTAVKKTSTKSV